MEKFKVKVHAKFLRKRKNKEQINLSKKRACKAHINWNLLFQTRLMYVNKIIGDT